jgi:hypothetical protein
LKIFVAWDFSDAAQRQLLEGCLEHHKTLVDGRDVEWLVPGISLPPLGDIGRDIVEHYIRHADKFIAVVDTANANVGWETGLAMGLQKPVGLAALRKHPVWTQQGALEGLHIQHVNDHSELFALVQAPHWRASVPALGDSRVATSQREKRVYVLCPDGPEGKNVRDIALRDHGAQVDLAPAAGHSLKTLSNTFESCSRALWIICLQTNDETGDGPANASNAVIAGLLRGSGFPLEVLRSVHARALADLAGDTRKFDSCESAKSELRRALQAPANQTPSVSQQPRLFPSPFIAGPPLPCGSPAFVGRYEAIHQIQQCLELGQPVQLLGEPRMGKTSLLNQVEQWLPKGVPLVSLTAQGNCGTSERELAAYIAEKLGRDDVANELRSGKTSETCSVLERLAPFALLLDEADELTKPGHQFSEGFFNQCRALGQQKRLSFVCAARSDLEVRFGAQGLTSRFLNDSRRIWVGQLEPEAREELLALAPQLTREQREFALEQAGGFAIALQWLGDAFVNGMSLDPAADQLRIEMERYFPTWWQGCSPGEQRLLRAAARGVERAPLTNGERRSLRALVGRGITEEGATEFILPGKVWREFVGEQ